MRLKNFSALLCVIVLSFSATVFADTENNDFTINETVKVSGQDENLGSLTDTKSTRDGSTRETYSLTDPEEIQKRLLESNHPMAGQDVSEIITIISMSPQEDFTPLTRALYLTNKVYTDRVYFTNSPLRTSSYSSPGGTMTVSEGVEVTWSSNTKVTAEVLEAELGYSHTSSHNISDAQNIEVPSGKRGYVTAYALHRKTTFDVYNNPLIGSDKYVGSGSSYKPNGVRFEIVIK